MAVIEEQVRVEEATTPEPTPPSSVRSGGGLGWLVVGLAVAAAVLAVVLAVNLGGDPEVTTGIESPGLIENGSITAIDHAAESAPGQSPGLVEQGGITAIDHAAASGGSAPIAPAGSSGGSHALIIENGSITAVDHAANAEP